VWGGGGGGGGAPAGPINLLIFFVITPFHLLNIKFMILCAYNLIIRLNLSRLEGYKSHFLWILWHYYTVFF